MHGRLGLGISVASGVAWRDWGTSSPSIRLSWFANSCSEVSIPRPIQGVAMQSRVALEIEDGANENTDLYPLVLSEMYQSHSRHSLSKCYN